MSKSSHKHKPSRKKRALAKSKAKTAPKTVVVKQPANPPKKSHPTFIRILAVLARHSMFRTAYAIGGAIILLATALLWALLGARLQVRNADQLSDPYMFGNWATFHGAVFPGAHTFLLKWPIFWLLHVFGVSQVSLLIATVGVVLCTVVTLAFVLYKIDRRPLVFGTVCLGVSLALLLVPAQPYATGLLPVNMAMLTTRNLEYAVYLVALALFARAPRVRSRTFVAGAGMLAVLIASDKLFLSLSVGGALLALATYAALRAWNITRFALRWLAGSIIAAAGATAILAGISMTHLTTLANGDAATPYGIVANVQNVVLGVAYSLLGLFTNAGANPVYDNVVLAKLPGELAHRLLSIYVLAYVAAATVLIYALVLTWRLAWQEPKAKPRAVVPAATLLALALIWSSITSIGVYIATNHYYAVDARYLSVSFFALAVSVSVGLRRHAWRWPEDLLLVGCNLLALIVIAIAAALHTASVQTTALRPLDSRNDVIATALRQNKVKALVGNYWRVLPIKLALHGTITALPLGSCTQPNQVLTSSVWQPDLHRTSFAYLLTITGSVADSPNCSIQQVVSVYGEPNATQVIEGTLTHPHEALLFYDQGSHPSATTAKQPNPPTILPVAPEHVGNTACVGPTIMNVVAHQDDDLLFMNPDLLHEIRSGDCIRTVYLTAGNAGLDRLYWLGRQHGSEAAYATMMGGKKTWLQRTVQLAKNEYITVASPRGNSNISLIFFNLPDGDLQGQGFASSNFQSLAKLRTGVIDSMETVDDTSSYTAPELTEALMRLMELYRPAEVHSQADIPGDQFPDHSDHIAAGKFAGDALAAYDQAVFGVSGSTPFKAYIGYPIHGYDADISGADLRSKEAAFMAYARFDDGVCHTAIQCATTPTYGSYLKRQYTAGP